MAKPVWIDPEASWDKASRRKCQSCGASVYCARVGRTMAVDVTVDCTPVLEGQLFAEDRLTWCFDGRRLRWRDAPHVYGGKCRHEVYVDHECFEGETVTTQDPFAQDRPEPKRDRWGRYLLPDPQTGKEQAWQRTTTFAKMCSDDYNLTLWLQRNVARGMGLRPDLTASAGVLDIDRDSKKLNEIVEQAKDAAGSNVAANLGTALHSMTELADSGRMDEVPAQYRERITEYQEKLKSAGIVTTPSLIERIVVHPTWGVAGTFDRIVKLHDGSYCVLDLKTGKNVDFAWKDIEVQLSVYQQASALGLWNPYSVSWDPGIKTREDFALVVHMPARGAGVTLKKVDLAAGRKRAELCVKVRNDRKLKPAIEEYTGGVAAEGSSDAEFLIHTSMTLDDLTDVMANLKANNAWSEHYANLCRARLEVIRSRA